MILLKIYNISNKYLYTLSIELNIDKVYIYTCKAVQTTATLTDGKGRKGDNLPTALHQQNTRTIKYFKKSL